MNVTLRVWRQANARAKGKMAIYRVNDISEDMSFLEMLDVLNERLTLQGDDPIAFDSDCRSLFCDPQLGKCLEACCGDGDCSSGETCKLASTGAPFWRCVPR